CPTRVCGSRTLDPLTVWLRDQAKQALHGTVLPRSATTKGPRRRKPDRMTKPLVMVNHQGLCCISLPLRDRPGRRASTPVRRSAPHEPRGRRGCLRRPRERPRCPATQRYGISPPASSQSRYVVLLLRIPYGMTHRSALVPLWLARVVQPEVLQCLVGNCLLAASGRLDDRLVVLGVQPRLYRADDLQPVRVASATTSNLVALDHGHGGLVQPAELVQVFDHAFDPTVDLLP